MVSELGAKALTERVFDRTKLGSREPIAHLSFLQLRVFVTFFVGSMSSAVLLGTPEWAREADFKHGTA